MINLLLWVDTLSHGYLLTLSPDLHYNGYRIQILVLAIVFCLCSFIVISYVSTMCKGNKKDIKSLFILQSLYFHVISRLHTDLFRNSTLIALHQSVIRFKSNAVVQSIASLSFEWEKLVQCDLLRKVGALNLFSTEISSIGLNGSNQLYYLRN